MSKLNCLYNAENILSVIKCIRNGGIIYWKSLVTVKNVSQQCPSPTCRQIIFSKWPENKFRYHPAIFTNSNFEPLIEEADDDVHNDSGPSTPIFKGDVVSAQVHRQTSAASSSSAKAAATSKTTFNEPRPKSCRPQSRTASKLSHISVLSGSRIIQIFDDRGSRLSGTISINSKLFADDLVRSSFRTASRNSNSSRYYSDYRLSNADLGTASKPKEYFDELDILRPGKKLGNHDIDDSLILETDYYVRQMKQRRNQVVLLLPSSRPLFQPQIWPLLSTFKMSP